MTIMKTGSIRNKNVEIFQVRDDVISTIKKRFQTYGYKQVETSTFENYDMYANMTGTINKDEMIKVVDSTGKVLVMRPDVTIPITRITAANRNSNHFHQRLFYVSDVYRQLQGQKENTQAGIEFFGENSPVADSETIMLASHTLKDLGFTKFKIEIGHAGFFRELVEQAAITDEELETLQGFIQSKNLTEIEVFLKDKDIDDDLKEAIQTIPMLYGKPLKVIEEAEKMVRNDTMKEVLQSLEAVYDVLQDYGVEDAIAINLGLINDMNYYTGIIFQGFVDQFGQPVLMGGRYDNLAKKFGTDMPAIGFAFEVDHLITAIQQQGLAKTANTTVDVMINYEASQQKEALQAAFTLRSQGFEVITYANGAASEKTIPAKSAASFQQQQRVFITNAANHTFANAEELIQLVKDKKEDL